MVSTRWVSKPGFTRLQREQAPQHEPGAHQQHHRDRDLRDHQRRAHPAGPAAADRRAALLERGDQIDPRGQRRQHREGEPGQHADARG